MASRRRSWAGMRSEGPGLLLDLQSRVSYCLGMAPVRTVKASPVVNERLVRKAVVAVRAIKKARAAKPVARKSK
jgi:hypothetical protein